MRTKAKDRTTLTDEQIKAQIYHMYMVEGKRIKEIEKFFHMNTKKFITLRNQVNLTKICAKCGESFPVFGAKRYCNKCVSENSKLMYQKKYSLERRKQEAEFNSCKKFKQFGESETPKNPRYAKVSEIKVNDTIELIHKGSAKENSYPVDSGTVKELYSHGFLLENSNGVKEFIHFVDVKTRRIIIDTVNGEKVNTGQI